MDLLDLDRRALAATAARIDALGPDDLHLPSPCAAWDVRAVINHIVANNVLYGDSAAGRSVDWDARTKDWLGDDPAGAFARSATGATEAFAAADLGAEVDMPFGRFTVGQAVAVHFVDILTHGWDIAVGAGHPARLDPELAEAAIGIVGFYPPDVFGTEQFFAEAAPVAADAPAGDRLVAMLGRRVPVSP